MEELKGKLKKLGLNKILIMDHGGYGSYHLQQLHDELPLSGIIEYTINGQNKYDKLFSLDNSLTNSLPYISIGKSPLKYYPDVSCGRLIGELTQNIVQEKSGFSAKIRDFTQFGIVGFGTLGQAAADQLKTSGAHNIKVYDVDEGRITEALLNGYSPVENSPQGLRDLLSSCNVIIVGTDKQPIGKEDFLYIKDQAIITGVTSADDTWMLDQRVADGSADPDKKKLLKGKIRPYQLENGKTIFAIYDGEAPNLAGSEIGVSDPSLNLPTSLHVIVAWHIAKHGKIPTGSLLKTPNSEPYGELGGYQRTVNREFNKAFIEMQKKAREANGVGGR